MSFPLNLWIGARGLGKSEKVREAFKDWKGVVVHRNADLLVPPDGAWLKSCFQESRAIAAADKPVLLVLDEAQRIFGWEGVLKEELGREKDAEKPVEVLLISSTSLPSQNFSAAPSYFSPLSFRECRERYGLSLEDHLHFGGFPEAVESLCRGGRDVSSWKKRMDSHLETVLGRDVFARVPSAHPSLLRQTLSVCLRHAGEVFSVNRLADEIQKRPHAKTVVGYLRLLEEAHLIRVLPKFSSHALEKSPVPCLIALDNGLIAAASDSSFGGGQVDREAVKRLAKNAVGARLFAVTRGSGFELFHWKDRRKEVDFVVSDGKTTIAFDIRSGWGRRDRGLKAFLSRFAGSRGLIIGPAEGGPGKISLARFLDMSWSEIVSEF